MLWNDISIMFQPDLLFITYFWRFNDSLSARFFKHPVPTFRRGRGHNIIYINLWGTPKAVFSPILSPLFFTSWSFQRKKSKTKMFEIPSLSEERTFETASNKGLSAKWAPEPMKDGDFFTKMFPFKGGSRPKFFSWVTGYQTCRTWSMIYNLRGEGIGGEESKFT